jgi:hypothetical protein
MTRPHRPWEGPSFTVSCKSLATIPICTPFTTLKAALPPPCLPLTWINRSQLETPRCHWSHSQNPISSDHLEPQHHTNHTQGHHPWTSTTAHARRPLKSWKNPGSYRETIGSATLMAWRCSTPTASQGWEGGWSRPPSTGTTSFLTTRNFSCHEGGTAPTTRTHLGPERTHTPTRSSQARRPIPSSWERRSLQWLTSPSDKNGTKLYVLRCSASKVCTTGSGIWPKTWPTSKNFTMTLDGKSITLYMPWPAPTPSTDLSHTSFMMPQRPRTSPKPCSTQGLTTLQTGGSMALTSTMSIASGARGMGTQHATACASINVYSVMELGTERDNVASHTRDVRPGESVASQTTTPMWPTLTAPRTSGPSDSKKDVNKGVMS